MRENVRHIETKSIELLEDVAALIEPIGNHIAARFIRRLVQFGMIPSGGGCTEAVETAEDDVEETLKCILALGYEINPVIQTPAQGGTAND